MPMKRPDQILPSVPLSTPPQMPPFLPDPSIRSANFDQLLRQRGVKFTHKRAQPCPNLRKLDDHTHDPNCTICGAKGFMYYDEREIIGMFSGNSLEKVFEQQGTLELGTTIVTFPTTYDDGTQADFGQYDQLILKGYEVRLWELKEYEVRSNKRQRLRYPITSIDNLSTVKNNVLKTYTANVDFRITNGEIEWIDGHTPELDPITGQGQVYAVSYYASPVYTVLQALRELRITQELIAGNKQAIRLSQELLVRKDFLVHATLEPLAG